VTQLPPSSTASVAAFKAFPIAFWALPFGSCVAAMDINLSEWKTFRLADGLIGQAR
jgi:hypothetical protein